MNYDETLDYLYSQVPMFQNLGAGAYKPGLDTTLALAEHWGNPQQRLKACIHVGGTNGKGSTAHTLAAILQSAGYKTALYTSPHLVDFRERMRINGDMIPRQEVVRFVHDFLADDSLVALHPTFFELTTIMALDWFARSQVDVAVIEVGLGGRLDCTNIITPVLSIITNISLDHTALLGHTEPEIAREKAGIIKPGVPVVIGRAEGDVRRVFVDAAAAAGAPIFFAEEYVPGIDNIKPSLTGLCQAENTRTILNAADVLRQYFDIGDDAVRRGFEHVCELTGLMGRWMTVATDPVHVVCDTGHNIGGWQYLGPQLCAIANGAHTLHMVLGFVNDKDVNAIMDTMPHNARYYYATPGVARGRAAADTAALGARHGLYGEAYDSVAAAYAAAQAAAGAGDTIFVGGSTFVVADFLTCLQSK